MTTILDKQRLICNKYSSKFCPLPPNEMVGIALDTLSLLPINGLRYPLDEGNNISWFIYCGDYSDADDFFKPIHISHLIEILPEVLPYLALEENFAFVIDKNGYEDIYKFN